MSNRVHGLHAVRAALEAGTLRRVVVDERRNDRRLSELIADCETAGVPVETSRRQRLDDLAEGGRHQGVVGEGAARVGGWAELSDAAAMGGLWLALDGVQDPHNLGACLRTAEAAGAAGVIAPRDRAAGLTATARKVATGAAERLPFYQVTNLARTLKELGTGGLFIVGAAGDPDTTLYEVDLTGPLILVLGAEERGLRRLTRENCDVVARLPMAGGAESLNVSVAAGVCLFEAARQRGFSTSR